MKGTWEELNSTLLEIVEREALTARPTFFHSSGVCTGTLRCVQARIGFGTGLYLVRSGSFAGGTGVREN